MSQRRRLLGVDPGDVRIGLAVSDPDRKIASPLTTYVHRKAEQDAKFFRETVEQEEIAGIVVGLAVHAHGEGRQAQKARRFGAWLTQVTGLPVAYWDESFSTVVAETVLWDSSLTHKRRRALRDRLAAQVMLQTYLDAMSRA